MELRHLRTIAAVARHGSFSKAAEELHLAQSAVSQQIRRFEQELGVEVFRRSSRSVEITPEGEMILGYAQRVLREVDGLHGELQELTGLVRGEVRIGGMYPTGPYDLAGLDQASNVHVERLAADPEMSAQFPSRRRIPATSPFRRRPGPSPSRWWT